MSDVTTITEARQIIEDERKQRAAAFWQALQSIQTQYNCTVTAEPAWRQTAEGTFTLAVRVAVQIGDLPAQAGMPEMPAPGDDEREDDE